jgi:hypothetical protein
MAHVLRTARRNDGNEGNGIDILPDPGKAGMPAGEASGMPVPRGRTQSFSSSRAISERWISEVPS